MIDIENQQKNMFLHGLKFHNQKTSSEKKTYHLISLFNKVLLNSQYKKSVCNIAPRIILKNIK